ncbi:MFS transporter [Paraburkholderia silvatlantica]|uniref:MFS transporter n=1 Tax=Paraburkholderia silvatlantica TaxID=321895 RepID=UPI003753DB0D
MPTLESDRMLDTQHEALTASQWRLIILASLGGALEFYDFVVYGVFAQYIGRAFFSMLAPLTALAMSFAVFAIGYLSRPLGGAVLSWFGDRYGRRRVFIVSVIVVSLSTIGMGLVPTYASWGIAATVTMILLRLIQGFCLGGELPGSITYVVETVPRRAGFVCGIVFFCVNSGVLLAAAVNLAVHLLLAPSDVAAYGWRIAFVFGGLIGLLGFWLRRKLEETPEFSSMKSIASKHPLAELLREHWRAVLFGIAATVATAGYNGLLFAHMPAYLEKVLHYDARSVAIGQNLALATASLGILVVGRLGDSVSRRHLMRAGALLLIVLSMPFYRAAVAHSMNLSALMILAGLGAALTNGTFACIVADMFPTRVRFSGVAIAFNLGMTIFSGPTPLVATWLIGKTGDPTSPGLLMIACAVITFAGTFGFKALSGHIGPRAALSVSRS